MKSSAITTYLLSILAIICFCAMQGYWLDSRYDYELSREGERMEARVDSVLDRYRLIRKETADSNIKVITKISRTDDKEAGWICRFQILPINSDLKSLQIIDISSLAASDTLETVNVSPDITEQEISALAYDHILELRNPFSVRAVDSLLNASGLRPVGITPTAVPHEDKKAHAQLVKSWTHPVLQLRYSYDQLTGKGVVMSFPISPSSVLRSMATTLLLTIGCGLLLTGCLIWQVYAIRRQRQISRLRNDYLASVLHELKHPLYTLKMFLSVISDPKKSRNEALTASLTEKAREEVDNLSQYFSKLRDFTGTATDALPLSPSPINLKELIEKCVAGYTPPANKDVAMETRIAQDIEIEADPNYLRSLILNLVENAVKYSGSSVAIGIDAAPSGEDAIRLTVKDNGWGISPSEASRCFRPYFRGSKALAHDLPGLGLGLSYVLKIVKAHNGAISISPAEGGGTVISITLPRK